MRLYPKIKGEKSVRRQINIQNELEVVYWSRRLGCSPEKLIHAVKKTGTSPVRVARELEKADG